MTHRHDGGPAFPRPKLGDDCGRAFGQQDGMSLRDWFAGLAIQSILTSEEGGLAPKADACREAYQYADAMLAARSEAKT